MRMLSCVTSFLLNLEVRNCFSARRCHNKVGQLRRAVLPPVPRKHLLFAMRTSKGLRILNCIELLLSPAQVILIRCLDWGRVYSGRELPELWSKAIKRLYIMLPWLWSEGLLEEKGLWGLSAIAEDWSATSVVIKGGPSPNEANHCYRHSATWLE